MSQDLLMPELTPTSIKIIVEIRKCIYQEFNIRIPLTQDNLMHWIFTYIPISTNPKLHELGDELKLLTAMKQQTTAQPNGFTENPKQNDVSADANKPTRKVIKHYRGVPIYEDEKQATNDAQVINNNKEVKTEKEVKKVYRGQVY